MTKDRQPHYWDRYVDGDGQWRGTHRPPGEDLAAMRRGIGRQPGTVPAMWKLHQVTYEGRPSDPDWVSPQYEGEHHALTLYAVHQQSRMRPGDPPAHQPGVSIGVAIRALQAGLPERDEGRASAIDRRFYAAVTATSVDEVAHHLRGLVRQLRALGRVVPLDYTQLAEDLADWRHPDSRDRVRRSWGLAYHARLKSETEGNGGDEPPTTETV